MITNLKRLGMFLLLLTFTAATSFAQDTPEGVTFVKELGGISEYTLDSNELSILLLEDHSAPVLTVMVTYNVGSRNEVYGTTGSTHLLEHLMFKGTDKYNREDGTGMDAMLQNRGARLNATTWLDRTNYYENLPSEHMDLALDIEADRMRNLWLRESDRKPEMTVVRNEFERGENSPFSALNKAIWGTAFIAHPYQHPTIGWKSDIENVSIAKLREFYDTYYWPNNATVTVIGDFETMDALNTVKEKFGKIPKSPEPIPEVYTKEPEQQGQKRVTVKRAGRLGVVGIAHKVPESAHPDSYALSVLNKILTDGKTSRLYKKLIDTGKATNVFTFYALLKDPSLFAPYIFLAPGAEHEEVEELVLAEYDSIKANGVTDEEVQRAINQINAETKFSRDGSFSIASQINEAIAAGDWTTYVTFLDSVKQVTPADVQEVVTKYFVDEKSTVGYFIPKRPGGMQGASAALNRSETEGKLYYRNPEMEHPATAKGSSKAEETNSALDTEMAKEIKEKTINGIRVFTMETGVKDVVTIQGSLPAGNMMSPEGKPAVASLVGSMLDKGTTSMDKFEIAAELENIGASINFNSGDYLLNFSARALRKDVPKVLNLLADQLQNPSFDAEELDKLKKQVNGSLQRQLENTGYMANAEMLRQIYPAGHPNYEMPVEEMMEALEAVTVEDLKAFHESTYGPDHMLLVAVGDIDRRAIQKEIKKAFKGWKGGKAMPELTMEANAPTAVDKVVNMEDKTSVSVMWGTPIGIDVKHEDYLPLYLGTYILGGNFSARLMGTVRDKEGLTYGIGSAISDEDFTGGHWNVRATFAPNLLEKGLASTMNQLSMWVNDGVTQEELDAKKSTVSGSYKVQLATTRGMANRILTFVEQGFDVEYMDQYVQDVEAVTLEQVNNAITKYVDLDKMVLVKAGTLESEASE